MALFSSGFDLHHHRHGRCRNDLVDTVGHRGFRHLNNQGFHPRPDKVEVVYDLMISSASSLTAQTLIVLSGASASPQLFFGFADPEVFEGASDLRLTSAFRGSIEPTVGTRSPGYML